MELQKFVEDVAAHLPGWVLDEAYGRDSFWVRLVQPDVPDAAIYFHAGDRGRAHVSGGYPHGFGPYREERLDITVSMDRAAEVVAKDIKRRFLGEYLVQFRAAQEAAYRAALQEVQARDLADELAAILGCEAQHGAHGSHVWSNHGSFSVSGGADGPYITVERLYSLTPELAKRMARVFAEE